MYCVKCKKKTETKDIQQVTSKNNRNMLRGSCLVCGTTKTQFISGNSTGKGMNASTGKGLINKMINNLPFEFHLPGHNFTGPGTNLKKRLNSDLTPKEWSKPYNRVDEAAMKHDICYSQNKDTKSRNEICDKKMLKDLNIFNPTIRERIDRFIAGNSMKAKMTLGMGQSPSGQDTK